MKTWEMVKELTENPEKKFYNKNEPEAGNVYSDGVAIRWEDTAEPVKLILMDKRDWEEVKKPVNWQEAFKAGLEGKMIKPVGQYVTFPYYKSLLHVFKYLLERPDYFEKVMLDDWYIE